MILCLIPVWSFQVKVKEETGSLCTSRWEKDQDSSSKTPEVSTSMKYKRNWSVNIKLHYFWYVEYRYPCLILWIYLYRWIVHYIHRCSQILTFISYARRYKIPSNFHTSNSAGIFYQKLRKNLKHSVIFVRSVNLIPRIMSLIW